MLDTKLFIEKQFDNNYREKEFRKPENVVHLRSLEDFCETYSYTSLSFTEKLYLFYHDILEYPKCGCGNNRIFKTLNIGYTTFCNTQCKFRKSAVSKKVSNTLICKTDSEKISINEKKKNTFLKKYGQSHPLKADTVKRKLEDTNLSKYGVKCSLQSKEIKDKIKNTVYERFKVNNVFESQIIQDKIKKTNIQKYGEPCHLSNVEMRNTIKNRFMEIYGVDNPLKNKEIRNKTQKTLQDKYGVLNASQKDISAEALTILNDKELLNNLYLTCESTTIISNMLNVSRDCVLDYLHKHSIPLIFNKTSITHSEIASFIKNDLGISIENNVRLFENKEIDIYIREKKLAIECNGTYWHSDLNGKDKNYHLNKKKLYEKNGIRVIFVWEHDWNTKKDIIKSRITHILGKSCKIPAKKCVVRDISNEEANRFLNSTHIQGTCKSSIRIGLFNDNDLVSVMTFGKSRFHKSLDFELLRFSSKLGFTIIGGASKLFSHFISDKPIGTKIISYAEMDFNTGSVYEKLGFSLTHVTNPGYQYTKNYKTVFNRINFQKNKLPNLLQNFDPELTEWENMKNNGYDRIWNCGNLVYLWVKMINKNVNRNYPIRI